MVLPFLIGLPFLIPYFLSSIRWMIQLLKMPPPKFLWSKHPIPFGEHFIPIICPPILEGLYTQILGLDQGIQIELNRLPQAWKYSKYTQIGLSKVGIRQFFLEPLKRDDLFLLKCQNGVGSLKQWDRIIQPHR